jgi:hypothetical protein
MLEQGAELRRQFEAVAITVRWAWTRASAEALFAGKDVEKAVEVDEPPGSPSESPSCDRSESSTAKAGHAGPGGG